MQFIPIARPLYMRTIWTGGSVEIFKFSPTGGGSWALQLPSQILAERGVTYDVVTLPDVVTASETPRTSHISLNRLAKAVVLKGR